MSGTECGCCGCDITDDNVAENDQGDLICECCQICILAEGLLYLADVEPAQQFLEAAE
jgi:hypothetical protein